MAEAPTLEQLATQTEELKAQRIIVLPRERTVQCFLGDNRFTVEEFERQVRAVWSSRPGIAESEKLEVVLGNVSRGVRDEVDCHPATERGTGEQVLQILKTVFGETWTISELLGLFYATGQRPGEPVREFSHRVNRAFQEVVKKQGAGGAAALSGDDSPGPLYLPAGG